MKLVNETTTIEADINILQLIEELKEKHRTIYWIYIVGQIYIYKPLGRRDHKEIAEDENLDTPSKEDEVIKRCLLYPYPQDFDIDNTEAGIIDKLFKTIIDNSFLTDIETRKAVMDYFRSEMFDLQEQITCIINEAFPQYDIEEIENWGIERTAKFLSRAEWKLQNFRGATFNYEVLENLEQQEESKAKKEPEKERDFDYDESSQSNSSNKKERMTPEKLAEMKRRFPEIDWDADVIANDGIEGMRESVDSTPVALRVGY